MQKRQAVGGGQQMSVGPQHVERYTAHQRAPRARGSARPTEQQTGSTSSHHLY